MLSTLSDAETRRAALITTTVSSFLTPLAVSSVNVALPSIGREFSMGAISLGWVATAYLLTAAMFLVPFSRLSDIHGRKKVFTYGTVIFTLASLLLAISPSAIALICFRVLQGIGSAMIFGTGVAILTSVYPAGEKGKVLGINVAAVYVGLSVGPFLGGIITQHLGWRPIFLVGFFLGLIIIAFIFWKLKGEWAEAKGERFDLIGSFIYGLTLVALMYGFSLLPAMTGGGLILIAVVGGMMFVWWELRVKSPVLNMNLFRKNTVFTLSNLAALINYSATFAVSFLLSLYLQYIKGYSPQSAGFVLIAQPVVQAIFSPLAGRLSDRVEPRIVASTGMALTAIGLSLLTFLNDGTGTGFIIASLILLGFGFALFSSPNTNAIMSSVDRRYYGVASGMVGTMRLIGQMFSMGIVMLIFALYIGGVQITPEYYPLFVKGVKTAFIIFAVLCFGGIFASLIRGNLR